MDTNSQARLKLVHPILAAKVGQLIDIFAAKGIELRVVQGLRTFAEQDHLYAIGRTVKGHIVTNARGGQSNHNFGLAVDLCPFVNEQPNWNDHAAFEAIGHAARAIGLEWGGDWKHITDVPHVQLHGQDVRQCLTWYNHGGLPAVWSHFK